MAQNRTGSSKTDTGRPGRLPASTQLSMFHVEREVPRDVRDDGDFEDIDIRVAQFLKEQRKNSLKYAKNG